MCLYPQEVIRYGAAYELDNGDRVLGIPNPARRAASLPNTAVETEES